MDIRPGVRRQVEARVSAGQKERKGVPREEGEQEGLGGGVLHLAVPLSVPPPHW